MNRYPIAVTTTELIPISVQAFPRMTPARALSPLPRAIENSGTPPVPNSAAKPMISVTIGNVSPTPVSAMPLPSPICPM